MATGFRWIRSPSKMMDDIAAKYPPSIYAAVYAVAAYVGQKMQNEARRTAPWEDRTSNARGGLFFAVDGLGLAPLMGEIKPGAEELKTDVEVVEGSDKVLTLLLGHTVYYGKYLETAHGARFAIIMSTIEANLSFLEKMLKDVFA